MSATHQGAGQQPAPPAGRALRLLGRACLGALAAAVVGFGGIPVDAQPVRPQATVRAVPPPATVRAGSTVTLRLHVELPEGVHVQAHAPRDPLLVPTVATVEAPDGTSIVEVVYPAPSEVRTGGASEPLLVLGPSFDVEVRVLVSASAAAGDQVVPVVLRYQACNETTCFPPARARAAWPITIDTR